jgi:NAD(P)-dependent dehydrogenase (short-subunit alcohol dehydrogenase family)
VARITGKACVVTGAGSGIGRATAVRLAEEGGSVLAVDISAGTLAETVSEIERAGGTAAAQLADVSDSAQVDVMVAACVERFGSIDVLVNNAGVNLPGVLHEVSDAEIDRTLGVNVRGPIYGCRAAIPHMLRQGGGSIINMSSVNGIVSEPFLAVYSASKGAIVMLTKGVALDYAKRGIRCARSARVGSTLRSTMRTLRCLADSTRCTRRSRTSSQSADRATRARSRTSCSSLPPTSRRS